MPAQVIQLAINDLNSGNFDQAQRRLSQFIEAYPSNPDGYFYLAAMFSRRHENDRATEYLCKAYERSLTAQQRMQMLTAMMHIGRSHEALAVSSGTQCNQEPASVCVQWSQMQAHLMWHAGHYQAALEQYERIKEAQSDNPLASVGDRVNSVASLAKAQIRLGQFDAATEVLESGVRQYSQDAVDLVDLLALMRLDMGQRDAAISLWRYAARLQPQTGRFSHAQSILASDAIALETLEESELSRVTGSLWVNSVRESWHRDFRWWGYDTALLQHAVETMPDHGSVIECGVFHGRSLNLMAECTDRDIHGFDSFEGIPEAWGDKEPAGAYSTNATLPDVPEHVNLHTGWFRDTLKPYVDTHQPEIALLHVDCDLYSSTLEVLNHLVPCLVDDAFIVFDDFLGYPGYEQHEYRAFFDYMNDCPHGFAQLEGAVLLDRAVVYRWKRHAQS